MKDGDFMYFHQAVSERIIEICSIKGYSPNKLAELSGIAPSTLNDIINNKVNKPNTYVLYRICKTLKIELKDFFDSDLFKREFKD